MDGYRAAATLLVSRDADQDELRRAFRARAKALHPDAGPEGSEAAFVELREAFDLLMATAPKSWPTERAPLPPQPSVHPRRQSTNRFESRPSFDARSLDVTDVRRRPMQSSVARRSIDRSTGNGMDRDRAARGVSFSRHLAATLTAMG